MEYFGGLCTFLMHGGWLLLILFFYFSPAYYVPALPVGGAYPGSGGGRPSVGRNRPLVFGGNSTPHLSDAPANPVWEDVLSLQVTCMLFTQRRLIQINTGKRAESTCLLCLVL